MRDQVSCACLWDWHISDKRTKESKLNWFYNYCYAAYHCESPASGVMSWGDAVAASVSGSFAGHSSTNLLHIKKTILYCKCQWYGGLMVTSAVQRMKHLELHLDVQALRRLPQCSSLSLLFHTVALHDWVSSTSSFETLCCLAMWSPVSQWCTTTSQKNRDLFSGCVHWLLRNGLILIIRPTGNVKSKLMKQHPYQNLY